MGLIIEEFDKIRPIWLLDSIKNMVTWSKKIKLLNNSFPRFNDSPEDCVDSVEDIIFNYYIIPKSTLDEISNEESSRLRRLDYDSLNQVKKFLPGGKRKTKKRKTRRRKTRKH